MIELGAVLALLVLLPGGKKGTKTGAPHQPADHSAHFGLTPPPAPGVAPTKPQIAAAQKRPTKKIALKTAYQQKDLFGRGGQPLGFAQKWIIDEEAANPTAFGLPAGLSPQQIANMSTFTPKPGFWDTIGGVVNATKGTGLPL